MEQSSGTLLQLLICNFVMKEIKIDLLDPQLDDNIKFANFLDPMLLSSFIKLLKDTNEKRTIEELFEAYLEGKL